MGQGIMGVATGMLALSLVACSGDGIGSSNDSATNAVEAATDKVDGETAPSDDGSTADAETESTDATADGTIDVDGIFTDRDMEQSPDLTDAKAIELASGQDSTIAEEGIYVITGTATDSTIVVEAPDDAKVQLVLSGVSVENADFPAIYVKSADKVFVTTVEGTTNSLSVTGTFVADGETNTDAVIFSHDDLTLNGLGRLSISSPDNGISGKDDIKVTGGTLSVSSVADAIEANESVSVSGGTISLDAQKDGVKPTRH